MDQNRFNVTLKNVKNLKFKIKINLLINYGKSDN